ncbi:hypothetical protein B296_00053773 [Ensete ventricosum]|uniref:Uncharacterized protein n=1 Tax=Ensete ventricosum TaxID=4639 RepID=A0A426Y6W6_ENSVE|nr:hypothetical protein B296_00053773 [Ensete ventricosum]
MWVCTGARQGFWSDTCAACRSRHGVLRPRVEDEIDDNDDDDDDGRRWLVVFVGIWMDSFGSHFTARAGISLRTHHLVAGRSSTFLNRCRGPDLDRRTEMERCDCRCAPLRRKMGWV